MNIIANNCAGGFIYKNLIKIEYENPFIWSLIDDDSFLYLLENYEKLNYNKYELVENKVYKNTYILIIDNKVKLQYIHYCRSNLVKPKVIGFDVYYNKIKEKIINEYKTRLQRMKKHNEKPIIIFSGIKFERSKEFYLKLKHYSTKYKIIVFTNQQLDILKTDKNFIVYKTKINEPSVLVDSFKTEIIKNLK